MFHIFANLFHVRSHRRELDSQICFHIRSGVTWRFGLKDMKKTWPHRDVGKEKGDSMDPSRSLGPHFENPWSRESSRTWCGRGHLLCPHCSRVGTGLQEVKAWTPTPE